MADCYKKRGPMRSPLRSGPLLLRSLTYVLTGATEPLDTFTEGFSKSVGSPPALSPSRAGLLHTGNREGHRSLKTLLRLVLRQRDAAVEYDAELRAGLHVGLLLLLIHPRARAESAAQDSADGSTLTAARDCADECARRRAAADEDCVALLVVPAFDRALVVGVHLVGLQARQRAVDRVSRAVRHLHLIEADGDVAGASTLRAVDHGDAPPDLAAHGYDLDAALAVDRLGHARREAVADARGARVQLRVHAHAYDLVCGDGEVANRRHVVDRPARDRSAVARAPALRGRKRRDDRA